MQKYFFNVVVILSMLARITTVSAQATISGPVCVIPGTVYQYTFKGNWSDSTIMQVCITGGILESSKETCQSGNSMLFVRVTWNENSKQGTISLKTGDVTVTANVSITTPLDPGTIQIATRKQVLSYQSVPSAIQGTPATGGGCSPQYNYQWQQSDDGMAWIDIEAAVGQSLAITESMKKTRYLRRKVTDTNSNSVAYTEVARIYVEPDTAGH